MAQNGTYCEKKSYVAQNGTYCEKKSYVAQNGTYCDTKSFLAPKISVIALELTGKSLFAVK